MSANRVQFTGPCGSSVGKPTWNFGGAQPEATVAWSVCCDKFDEWKAKVFGTWCPCTTRVQPDNSMKIQCPGTEACPGGFMEAYAMTVKTRPKAVGKKKEGEAFNLTSAISCQYEGNNCSFFEVLVKYKLVERTVPAGFFSSGETALAVKFPARIKVDVNSSYSERTTNRGLKFCDDSSSGVSCCKEKLDSTLGFPVPIATDNISVKVTNQPCPNYELMKSLKGQVNKSAFLGYPPGAVLYNGYTIRCRQDCYCQPIFDISFNMIAKTVPACGESADQIQNGCIGFWGKAWCKTGKISGSGPSGCTQHWLPACEAGGSPIFDTTDSFAAMIQGV